MEFDIVMIIIRGSVSNSDAGYAAKRKLRACQRTNCATIGLSRAVPFARAYGTECCKPFQTFQVLEMDGGANVLNFPNTCSDGKGFF